MKLAKGFPLLRPPLGVLVKSCAVHKSSQLPKIVLLFQWREKKIMS